MSQQFIDVELLKSYRTANDETKALLHKIYGYDTFNLYNQNDEWILLGTILKMMLEDESKEVTYGYNYQGKPLNLVCRLEPITTKNPDEVNPVNSEKNKSNINKLFDRFKQIKKNLKS